MTAPPDAETAPAANGSRITTEAAPSTATTSRAIVPAAEALNPVRTGPYGRAALDYYEAGWRGVIPVKGKSVPPSGFTGADGADTSYPDVHTWTEDAGTAGLNVGLRLPAEVVGIDVDAYGKRNGARTLTDAEAEWGPLPATVISTSRTDGVSGIRLYRVEGAAGLAWPANLDGLLSQDPSHVDIIRRSHRYAMVEPSVHPITGLEYRWLTADGTPLDGVPKPDDLPHLPDAWVVGITAGLAAGEHRPAQPAPSSTGGLLSVPDERPSKHEGPIPDGVRHATLVSYAGHMRHLGIPETPMAETLMLARLEDCQQPPHAATPVTREEALDKLHDVYDRYPAGRVVPEDVDAVEAVEAEPEAPRRNTPLDWTTVLDGEQPEPDWLAEPLLEAGTSVALYSPPKAGKSLLALDICAGLAAGRSVLGNAAREPVRVLYLDLENTPADLAERLRDMAYTPAELGDRLTYLSFPTLPPLDTAMGGSELVGLVEEHRPDVVVLDTLSRFVEGDENEAQTYADLYRYSLMRLKALKVAVLRLDHAGKDMTKGQRGSSAKSADVDAVWRLSPGVGGTVELVRDISRNGHGADRVSLARLSGPLRHEPVTRGQAGMFTDGEDPRVEAVIRALDDAAVPLSHGRALARQALTSPVRDATLGRALRVRRERADERDDDDSSPFGDLGGGVA